RNCTRSSSGGLVVSERATVVVITYNRRDELRRTLRAMTSLPDAAPIVLADNGSSDGSAAMAEAEFPDVTVVRLPRNLGATARNIAVEQVSTPYVAFCDDDTVWQPGALTTAADVLDEYPGLATVTGRCLVEPTLTEDLLTPELRNSPVPGPDWMPGPTLLGIMAGLTMIRRRAFHEVGGFEPRMWLGGEEELLALDLAAAGWWMCWREDVVIHHRPSTSRDARRRRQLGIRNTLWTLWLRRPVRSALRRSTQIVRSAPADRYTALAVLEAVRSLGWVVRNRVVVPSRVESGLLALEDAQVHSAARRYVG
ncbi:glycosyltransferase family 2 protein, partial [Prescottella equi]|uniref:glycosyltransferase family 2 protein n=1 Tax=Rhodococcus hoagii TaxID=43767 RepID=UPI00300FD426